MDDISVIKDANSIDQNAGRMNKMKLPEFAIFAGSLTDLAPLPDFFLNLRM